jgi:zinc/manganese transport system permease protein
MGDALALLTLPFAAAVVFVLIHGYLGIHVLRRRVVFADLALAQLSALGASVAFANGYAPASPAGFGYALLFTAIGAALLTLIRSFARVISQEALVGILYVTATAATILVVDRSPQGAEHVKKILIGSILTVGPAELAKFTALYAAVGALHWFARRPLLAASSETAAATARPAALALWDFVFFLSFGVVVTSSVTTAGVLLVFSFLIVPPVLGFLYSRDLGAVLAIAWGAGILASAAGLAGSYLFDLPTGAAMVSAFALVLVVGGLARALVFVSAEKRRSHARVAGRAVIALGLLLVLAASLWLVLNPAGDQPLAAAFERATGIGPQQFLSASERDAYESAARDVVRFQTEANRLDARERAARYQGSPLSDEEIRRIASYQQSFNEMTQGERFVQDVLRAKARRSERWIVGLPVALLCVAALGLLFRPERRRREPAAPKLDQPIA